MQNIDTGLAPLVICPVCTVADGTGTEPKLWSCPADVGEECGYNRGLSHAKFDLDPSNRLATIHQRHRQTATTDKQDRQRSDSIGRTVLQMVAPKTKSGLLRILNTDRNNQYYHSLSISESEIYVSVSARN